MKRKLTILLTILFVGFAGLGINDIRQNQVTLQMKEVELQDKALELNQLKLEKEHLNRKFEKEINSQEINEEKVKQLEKEKLELERKTEQLERELQAKRNGDLKVAGVATAASFKPTGNKESWLRASGIPESQWWAVDYIVSRESGWQPCAFYPGGNDCNARPVNACGLVQQNPCHKIPGDWRDPVAALKWQYNYVNERYGGYAGAVAYWKVNHHY